ncbi:MAG: FAD:protein FMN transferase [Parcubacteria group bacterium]|jgi:thiamine biosynthesis lipoprotein
MNLYSEKISFKALGTDIQAEIIFGDASKKEKAESDLESLKDIYFTKQKIFCRFYGKSELNRLNSNLGSFQKALPDIVYLAKRALFYNKLSGGMYDPRVIEILEKIGYKKDFKKTDFSKMEMPENFDEIATPLSGDLKIREEKLFFARRMDFSGIAKGYITDCAAKFLKSRGWHDFLINSGGDMSIAGKNAEGEKWRIEIEGVPKEKMMLEISERGIATSGISRKKWQIKGKKFHHLVNPKDPNSYSYEIRTVSVIAKNTENADGRAKTLVLMGKERGMNFAEKNGIAAVFLDYKGGIFITPESKKYLAST